MEKPNQDRSIFLLEHEREIGLCARGRFASLRFPDALEEQFYADTTLARRKRMFWFSLLAIVLFDLFAALDKQVVPDIYEIAWTLRLGLATPVCLVLILIMMHPGVSRYIDYFAGTITLIGVTTVGLIFASSNHINALHFHTGLLPIVMYANIVLRLRFRQACFVSLAACAVYFVMIVNIEAMSQALAMHYLSVMLIGTGISLMAAYQLERDVRSNYLRQLTDEIKAIRLTQARDAMEKISVSDALTGLANRRHFDGCLEAEWQAALVSGSCLSLVFIDVDDFKAYNDHFGHQGGDECLRTVAQLAQRSLVRAQDLCARYGGEEFVVLLANTPLEVAAEIAERIRSNIAGARLPHPKARAAQCVTASLGVACVKPVPGLDMNDLVEQADQALYQAKALGRNRVQTCTTGNAGET